MSQQNDDHLKSVLSRQRPEAEAEPEDDSGRPDLSGPYRAFGHPRAKFLSSMLVYFNAEGRRKYGRKKIQIQYRDLESDDPTLAGLDADGQGFSLIIAGQVSKQRLIVRGRNLEEGFDYVSFHRMPWIRAAERDFGPEGEPLVSSIEMVRIAEA